MCGFAYAKSGYSGVGGAAKWREFAKQIFETELHHRGSKRYITPPVLPQQRILYRSQDDELSIQLYPNLPK